MIKAIKQIGEMVEEKIFLKSLVRTNDRIDYIVKINFNTQENKIEIVQEECDEQKLYKYLWIGHFVSGSHSNKFYLTTNKKDNANKIPNEFFKEINTNTKDIINKCIAKNIKYFENFNISDYKEHKTEKNKNYLYSFCLNNVSLVNNEDYMMMVENEIIEKHYKKSSENVCSFCNERKNIAHEIYVYKFYNIDKHNASSNVSGDFSNNFSICKECFKLSLKGQRFIENNFKSSIGRIDFFVIPHFYFDKPNIPLEKYKNIIMNLYNPGKDIQSLYEFEKRLKQYYLFSKDKGNFLLNYLFYEQNKSQFSVLKLIKDVSPTRITELTKIQIETNKISILDKNRIRIGISSLYYLIPIKISKKKEVNFSYYMDLIDCILSIKKINLITLIDKFRIGIKIKWYKNKNYNLGEKGFDITTYLIRCNFFILFLYKLSNIKQEYGMQKNDEIEEIYKLLEIEKQRYEEMAKKRSNESKSEKKTYNRYERLLNFIEPLKEVINKKQKLALILLGFIMSEIVYKQKKSGLRNLPILNKINYDGMKYSDVQKLSNILFKKLQEYKIVSYNDFFNYLKNKSFISVDEKGWDMSSSENVFYILSGYSAGAVYIKTEEDKEEEVLDESENMLEESDSDNEEEEEEDNE